MRQVLQVFFSALVVLSVVGGASAETTNGVKENPRGMKQPSTEVQEETIETSPGEQKSIETQGATTRDTVGKNQDREVTQQDPVGTMPNRRDPQQEPVGTIPNPQDSQQEPVGFVDQLKEGVKGEVNRRSKEINEKVDRFGQP